MIRLIRRLYCLASNLVSHKDRFLLHHKERRGLYVGGNQQSVSHLSIFGSDAPLWIKLSAFKLDGVNKT